MIKNNSLGTVFNAILGFGLNDFDYAVILQVGG
jgi:hypothetical protein